MERRAIMIRGTVQGVGLRPYVYELASRYALRGFVRNQVSQVRIEVEGETASVERFLAQLTLDPPPLARIEEVAWELRPVLGEAEFRIEPSLREPTAGHVVIAADAATCAACRAELLDPHDRRYRYPFLNCTHCGPRLTIVTGAPYDRERTTMATFPMCPACRAEYEDPTNRRFHAQPTACAACGPRLAAWDRDGVLVEVADPMTWFAQAIAAGKIGAMKGLGGYHLVCDARNAAAVAELRRRKHRDAKPFAVMVPDVAAAETFCEVSEAERRVLDSPRRPIVLLRRRGIARGSGAVAEAIAPGNPRIGVLLPYTPLHIVLLAAHPRPAGPPVLVMTSGNRSDEPIAYRDDEVLAQLGGIADLYLTHNRPIHIRCDDSVTRIVDGAESPIRRSRGYAPQPIALPMDCPRPLLAVGGQMKGAFALAAGRRAVLSHHLGDLDHFAAYQAFVHDVAHYARLLEMTPARIVHDLHPDYASTRYARERAIQGVELVAVQHHHAHMASCMAEHGLVGRTLGVIFDGTGYGTDGAIWGGEFLVGDYAGFRRAAHLRYVGLPGGEQAIRQPWRMALAYLLDAGLSAEVLADRVPAEDLRVVAAILGRGFRSPPTSSVGRLFDAVSALLGLCAVSAYEGQPAMLLEWAAENVADPQTYPFDLTDGDVRTIDFRPAIRQIVAELRQHVNLGTIAARFHRTLAQMIVTVCQRVRQDDEVSTVVLSGGCFMNATLACAAAKGLESAGFRVFRQQLVPPNDGGLSLGQAAIAAAQLSQPAPRSQGVADVSGNPRQSGQDLPGARCADGQG